MLSGDAPTPDAVRTFETVRRNLGDEGCGGAKRLMSQTLRLRAEGVVGPFLRIA